MDLSIIYTKTSRGSRALIKKLPAHAGQVLSVINGQQSAEVIFSKLKKISAEEFEESITWLVEGGFIKIVLKNPFPSSIWAPPSKNAIQVAEISLDEFKKAQKETEQTQINTQGENTQITLGNPELDENSAAIIQNLLQADEEARERAEAQLKAQSAVSETEIEARIKAEQEARERAEAEARMEKDMRERAEAEKNAKDAEIARAKAEAAAKARLESESKAQAKKEAKARAEAEAKRAEQARLKAEQEAKALAEQKAREEAAELARKKAEQEARERAEAETRKRAEEARIQAEQAAKAKAEEEARLHAEKIARERAEAAEQARLKAEAEAEAKAKAEREAWEKAEAEAKAKAEAKAERKARQKAEAEAKAQAEARAKAEAEVAAKTLAVQNALAEAEAAKKALALATTKGVAIEQELVDFDEALSSTNPVSKPNPSVWKKRFYQFARTAKLLFHKLYARFQQVNSRKNQRRVLSFVFTGFEFLTNLFKKGLLLSLLMLVIATIAALFINLRLLIAPVEQIAASSLNEPVKIESIHAFLLPTPHLSLDNVHIGSFSKTIDLQRVQLYLSPLNLKEKVLDHHDSPYLLKSINVDGMDVKQSDWKHLTQWLKSLGQSKQLVLDSVALRNIKLRFDEANSIGLDGKLSFKNNVLDRASFNNQDKNLEVTAKRDTDNNNYQLTVKAHSWRTPFSPNLLFLDLEANGTLNNDTLSLSPISGQAYDGDLKANVTMNLSNGNVNGDYVLEKMNLTDLALDLKLNSVIDGALSMHANFSFNADSSTHQLSSTKLSGHFSIANGAVRKIDISEAMRSGNLGGTTHFSSLEGDISLNRQEYQFSNLLLRDNQLEANGNLQITADNSVVATINSKILVKSNPIKARLNIIGNVNNLSLRK